MHSRWFNYTDEDKEHADTPVTEQVIFHFNSDMSGEVIIENEISVIRVPGWMLLEFVGQFMQSQFISSIENQSGREMLYTLQRGLA